MKLTIESAPPQTDIPRSMSDGVPIDDGQNTDEPARLAWARTSASASMVGTSSPSSRRALKPERASDYFANRRHECVPRSS